MSGVQIKPSFIITSQENWNKVNKKLQIYRSLVKLKITVKKLNKSCCVSVWPLCGNKQTSRMQIKAAPYKVIACMLIKLLVTISNPFQKSWHVDEGTCLVWVTNTFLSSWLMCEGAAFTDTSMILNIACRCQINNTDIIWHCFMCFSRNRSKCLTLRQWLSWPCVTMKSSVHCLFSPHPNRSTVLWKDSLFLQQHRAADLDTVSSSLKEIATKVKIRTFF